MRVALIIGAKGWRGSVASFVKVAEGLARRGHSALFLTAQGPVPVRLRELGHDVEILDALNTGPKEVLALHRHLRRSNATAIYADTPRDLRLAAYATRLRSCPVVYRYNVNARPPRGKFGDRLFARAAAAVVVLSHWVGERLTSQEPWLAARPQVRIPNGFDTEQLRPDPVGRRRVRAELGLSESDPVVLCASIFAPGKRQELLIDALRILNVRGRRVTCLLAGGEERTAVFGVAAKESGVDIRWLGRPAPEAMPALYSAADVVAQPCAIESFGNVIGEAMACERAVVVPNAGAAPEVAGAAAEIVAAEDANAWASAIASLLDSPERRATLGRLARERIMTTFPVSAMQDAHVALFERLSR